MTKKLSNAILLLPFLIEVLSAENYFNISYDFFPITRYAILRKAIYSNGVFDNSKSGYIQQEEKYSIPTLSLRIGKEYSLTRSKMLFDMETGLSMTIGSAKTLWSSPNLPTNYSGEIIYPIQVRNEIIPIGYGLSNDTEKKLTEEIKALYLPIIVKFGYEININKKLKIPIKLGGGFYFVHSTIERTYEQIYVISGGSIVAGDNKLEKWKYNSHGLGSLIDFSVGGIYKYSEKFSVGININIDFKNKISNIYIMDANYMNILNSLEGKEGQEFGGLGYGLGLGINFTF